MRTDFVPEGNGKERNLAAGRGDRFSGTAQKPAEAARDRRRRLAKTMAASLLAHGCLLLACVFLDGASTPSGPAREISVDVVTEPAPPEKKPAGLREATQAQAHDPRQMPETEAHRKPANEAMSDPNPSASPAAPKSSAPPGPEARATPAGNDIAYKESAQERPPAARRAGGPRQNGGSERLRPMQTGVALPFDSGPDDFRAVAMPLVSKTGGEAVRYQLIVGGMLEQAKHYPETARRRRAKGIAMIGFVLDGSGRIAAVSLLRSSGEVDLDAESVALVKRAAPFPPPPQGAQESFAIEVAFGMGS